MAYDYDLFVIGAGSGGVRASRIAATHGARVGICEDYRVGGTCVIRGCVPKKLLMYGSKFAHDFEDAAAYGWTVAPPTHSWVTLRDNVNREVDRLNAVYLRLLDGAGVKLHMGRGRLMDRHTIQVGEETITAEKILIATGGHPVIPSIPGAELAITSSDAFHLPELPRHITIVGAGYIAVEFAGIFRGLGAKVDIVLRRDRVLRGFDEECRTFVHQAMVDSGIRMRTEMEIGRIVARGPDGSGPFEVHTPLGGKFDTDCVMYATGRAPNTSGLGREKVGVQRNKAGAIAEEQAKLQLGELRIYTAAFRPMKYTVSGRHQRTFMKMIVEAATDRVVGIHMVGDDAAELIQGLAVAMKAGATKAHFDATVGIHPTAGEEFVTMRTARADTTPTRAAAE